ncbi:MAG: hypothetical protein HQL20_03195 [Candidatus Omnitrophica bacterium]|nr:hypothetical protein [Candidatus Omnitrophota bacterium]
MLSNAHPLELLALVASVVMPMWNIPLIIKIFRRRSSADLSMYWLWGVWGCMLLMLPWAFLTKDNVLRVFSCVNFVLFSGVAVAVMKFRKVPDARN